MLCLLLVQVRTREGWRTSRVFCHGTHGSASPGLSHPRNEAVRAIKIALDLSSLGNLDVCQSATVSRSLLLRPDELSEIASIPLSLTPSCCTGADLAAFCDNRVRFLDHASASNAETVRPVDVCEWKVSPQRQRGISFTASVGASYAYVPSSVHAQRKS